MRKAWAIAIAVTVLSWMPLSAPMAEPGKDAKALSVEAQGECDQGRRAKDRETRLAHFEKGEELAEDPFLAFHRNVAPEPPPRASFGPSAESQ